jgi:type III pantothenate kinase
MIVLIDSGNTRIKVGVTTPATAGKPALLSQLACFDNADIDALRAWLSTLPKPIELAWGVNVAGVGQQTALNQACAAAGLTIAWQTACSSLGRLVNGYASPQQLGADRWAALVGISQQLPTVHPPVIMATFGTATTIDVIGPDDVFAGGIILPGPSMMRHVLSTGTADLPLASGPIALWPTNTDGAIASGVASAQAGALTRQVLAVHARWGCPPVIYASGGGWLAIEQEVRRMLAQLADSSCDYVIEAVQHPVLGGLARMAALAGLIG